MTAKRERERGVWVGIVTLFPSPGSAPVELGKVQSLFLNNQVRMELIPMLISVCRVRPCGLLNNCVFEHMLHYWRKILNYKSGIDSSS